MKQLTVIGIGNILMQDDGIGVIVVNAIKNELHNYDIMAIIGETDVQYCLDNITQDDSLIIIDGMQPLSLPGNIQLIELNPAIKNEAELGSLHQLSLFDALKMYYPDIQGFLIGIETAQISMGVNLSNQLEYKFQQICDDVVKIILKIKKQFT